LGFGLHCQHGLDQRQQRCGLTQGAWRLGLAQLGQKLAHFAQIKRVGALMAAHGDAHRHPLHSAEQIHQHRHGRGRAVFLHGFLEQDRGAAFGDQPGLDLGHFQKGRDRLLHPHKFAHGFKPGDEIPQGPVGHGVQPSSVTDHFDGAACRMP